MCEGENQESQYNCNHGDSEPEQWIAHPRKPFIPPFRIIVVIVVGIV